jgi:hypothetical protein
MHGGPFPTVPATAAKWIYRMTCFSQLCERNQHTGREIDEIFHAVLGLHLGFPRGLSAEDFALLHRIMLCTFEMSVTLYEAQHPRR